MRPPSGQDDGLRLFAADKQMGRTELLPFTPNVCVLRCRRVQLRGELCSALGAATGEDLAAVGGSHSLSEAMHLGSVTLSGLIGTNSCHGFYTSCKNMLNSRLRGRSESKIVCSPNIRIVLYRICPRFVNSFLRKLRTCAHPHAKSLYLVLYLRWASGFDRCCASSSVRIT